MLLKVGFCVCLCISYTALVQNHLLKIKDVSRVKFWGGARRAEIFLCPPPKLVRPPVNFDSKGAQKTRFRPNPKKHRINNG